MKEKLSSKIIVMIIISILIITGLTASYATIDTGYYIGEKDVYPRKENKLSGVTEEMCTPEYWEDKTIIDWDQQLMNSSEIVKLNKAIVDGSGTKVFNLLTDISEVYDADAKRESLASATIPTRDLYIDGLLIDNDVYFGALQDAIRDTGYTGTQNVRYGVCTNRVDMRDWPIDDMIGYSPTDRDDEMQSSAMNLNEPFAIYAKCEVDQDTYYWGYSNNCTGWVNAKNIALCDTKDEWTNYWLVDHDLNNYIVDVGGKINLNQDGEETVKMMLGTILKLVPDDEIPDFLQSEAASNYIAYFAGRDSDGKAVTKYAVLNESIGVNKGFLELTQENLLTVAFECLGDDFGWGGMKGNMDCSMYARSIYKCFGFELPRNTSWQIKTPGRKIDISSMNDEEKTNYISTLPAGSLLYFEDLAHVMMYIGMDDDKNFIVSDLGKAADEDSTVVEEVYSVNINSVNVKRANGTTWLSNLGSVLLLSNELDINECQINVDTENTVTVEDVELPTVSVLYNNHVLYEDLNYEIEYIDNLQTGKKNIKISGISNFTGEVVIPSYSIISGETQAFVEKKVDRFNLSIDGDYSFFASFDIANLGLERDVDYEVIQGSTIISLTQSGINKLNTLSPGEYKAVVTYENEAKVTSNLIINKDTSKKEDDKKSDNKTNTNTDVTNEQESSTKKNPKTGDDSILFMSLAIMSLIGYAVSLIVTKKINK